MKNLSLLVVFSFLGTVLHAQGGLNAGQAAFTKTIARSIQADQNQFNPQPPNADIQELQIDLNDDGLPDLRFKTLILQQSAANWQHSISCDIPKSNPTDLSVCVDTWPLNYAQFYQAGQPINQQCNGAAAASFILSRYGSNGALPFTPLEVDTTYMAFRFIENGDTTQGWIALGLHNNSVTRLDIHEIGSDKPLNSQALVTHTEEVAAAAPFQLYPNPAHTEVALERASSAAADYRILDVSGRIQRQGRLLGNRHRLSIADLPAGWYLLQVMDAEGLQSRRLHVQ